jgi:hypothetical protein
MAYFDNRGYATKSDSNYLIAKWISQSELKQKIAQITKRHLRANAESSIFGALLPFDDIERSAVDEFWDSNDTGVPLKTLIAVLTLQATFRMWLALKKLRNVKSIKFGAEENILLGQTAVRRWLAVQEVARKVKEREVMMTNFANFCKKLRTGYEVIIFSKKHGQAWKRKISFSKDLKCLMYPTSSVLKKKIPLGGLYEVRKGMSGYFYPLARPQHKLWCLHILHLVGKRVDIECLSANEFREVYYGLRMMILLHISRSPFYIDGNGIPRRAGPSIIEYVVDSKVKGCRSEADRVRFEEALRQLNGEYQVWAEAYAGERQTWLDAQEEYEDEIEVEVDDDDEDEDSSDDDSEEEEEVSDDDDDDTEYEEEEKHLKLSEVYSEDGTLSEYEFDESDSSDSG